MEIRIDISPTELSELLKSTGIKKDLLEKFVDSKPENIKQNNDGITADLTLSEFYENWYLPKIATRKRQTKATIAERNTAMKYWISITGNPKLSEINDDIVDSFTDGLYKAVKPDGKQLSDQTIRKHLSAIESVLMYAGPQNDGLKRALGLIDHLPEFPSIKKRVDVNSRTPTIKEFESILKACRVAERPKLEGITAPEWWECAFLFLYSTGIRYQDFIGAKWSHIKQIQNVKALIIPPENEKTHRERIVPLNKLAQSVLNRLPRTGREDNIFQWDANYPGSVYKGIVKERQRIAKAAFVKPILATFHAIRRLTATMLDPAAAANVLGNNPITCRQHYQTVVVAARAVEALPMPQIPDF